jgi:hypothetical protein
MIKSCRRPGTPNLRPPIPPTRGVSSVVEHPPFKRLVARSIRARPTIHKLLIDRRLRAARLVLLHGWRIVAIRLRCNRVQHARSEARDRREPLRARPLGRVPVRLQDSDLPLLLREGHLAPDRVAKHIKAPSIGELREPPTHPGEMLLEEFLRPRRITQVEAARQLKISTTRTGGLDGSSGQVGSLALTESASNRVAVVL